MRVVFDIGAHQGTTFDYWLLKTKKFDGGRVFCFEPSPRSLPLLLQKAHQLRHRFNIVVCPFALTDYAGTVPFYQKKSDPCADTIFGGNGDPGDIDCGYALHVACLPLTGFMAHNTDSEDELHLKIDAEGVEYDILDDLLRRPDLLKRVKELRVEFHPVQPEERQHRLRRQFAEAGCAITEWGF